MLRREKRMFDDELTKASHETAPPPTPIPTPTPTHGASRLVLAMPAWPVKTRRDPSHDCRDASVYGHTTLAMLDNEPSPLPRPGIVGMPRRSYDYDHA